MMIGNSYVLLYRPALSFQWQKIRNTRTWAKVVRVQHSPVS